MNSNFFDYDLVQLRHFYAIAYFGGFSRASRATGLSQPALSSGLKKLEGELGTQLIIRTSTKFKLTPAGASLFEFCQELSAKWGDLHSSISEHGTSFPLKVRVGTAISVGYAPLVRMMTELSKSNRPIDADVEMAESYQTVRSLQEGRLDLAFLPDDVQAGTLHFEPISKEPLIFVGSNRTRASFTGDHWRSRLGDQTLINYPRATRMRGIIERILMREKIKFRSEISVGGIEAIKLFILRGTGFAFVLKSLVHDELKSGALVEIHIPITLPKFGINVACRFNDRHQLRQLLDVAAGAKR